MKDENGRHVDDKEFIEKILDDREKHYKIETRLIAVEQRMAAMSMTQTWVLVIGVLLMALIGFVGFALGKLVK